MARHRSIRFKKIRRKSLGPMELDITSLLDILVILLVFLLKSYNTSGIIIPVPKDIKLPASESQSPNNPGVIIQVSEDKIWVDTNEVLDKTTSDKSVKLYDQGGRRIISLFEELVKVRENIENINQQTNSQQEFTGIANLVVDKSIKYIDIKRILYTTAAAGFKTYKFVVLGEDQ